MNKSDDLAPPEQVSGDVSGPRDPEGLLALMGKELKVSRSYIITVDSRGIGKNTHEWCLPGIGSQKNSMVHFFISEKWIRQLKEEGVILISDINQVELRIRAELGRQNILALAAVPLWNGEELWGFLGVDECVVKNRKWRDEEIQKLRRFSGLVNDVYQRINANPLKD
ncbi:MAG: GAF domain-containing protein [Treponema sp.]|jgi:GAF domain-containing protein|nr:GAF domain-containing protein [Treponema sp.]